MQRIGYILRSYPRLSQTFIVNEILALEQLGLNLHLFAITNPHEPIVQAQVGQVRAPVEYLEDAATRGRAAVLAEHAWVAAASARALCRSAQLCRAESSTLTKDTPAPHASSALIMRCIWPRCWSASGAPAGRSIICTRISPTIQR